MYISDVGGLRGLGKFVVLDAHETFRNPTAHSDRRLSSGHFALATDRSWPESTSSPVELGNFYALLIAERGP
jgi:hypothetical protein